LSWCDKLASTPTVGFKLSAHFAPVDTLLHAFSPILDRQTEEDVKLFNIDPPSTHFSVGITTNDGFKYAVDESRVSVAFSHRVKFRHVSGGPPIMEMLSRPLPFTTLLTDVSTRVVEATLLLPEVKKRTLQRVGVISATPISAEDIPPGIKRFIDYVGRPWTGMLDSFNISINAHVGGAGEVKDRCLHTIVKPEDKDQLLTLVFDWHRTFSTEWQITKSNLERILKDAQRDSLQYFEDLAEGSRFDEVLIREAANI
jgi:hypothetical protein